VRIFDAFASLIFPRSCVACGGDVASEAETESAIRVLCLECQRQIKKSPVTGRILSVPFITEFEYGLEIAAVVVSAKDDNDRECRRYLANSMAISLMRAMTQQLVDPDLVGRDSATLLLIPFPSRASADRTRGFAHSERLAREIVRELSQLRVASRVFSLFELSRDIKDQRGLTRQGRQENLASAYRISQRGRKELETLRQAGNSRPPILVLIDDVMTSGATMGAGISCLHEAGFEPDLALLGCVSPRLIYA
jgi:predicted amidophosphoribosyltransferase